MLEFGIFDTTDIPDGETWSWNDLTLGHGPATIVSWTSSYSDTGSFGAPELATAEKGDRVFAHAVEHLVALATWMRDRPKEERQDLHATPPTFPLPFAW